MQRKPNCPEKMLALMPSQTEHKIIWISDILILSQNRVYIQGMPKPIRKLITIKSYIIFTIPNIIKHDSNQQSLRFLTVPSKFIFTMPFSGGFHIMLYWSCSLLLLLGALVKAQSLTHCPLIILRVDFVSSRELSFSFFLFSFFGEKIIKLYYF